MASMTNLEDLFLDMLKDVYYAEKKILKALPKMEKAIGKESKLAAAFNRHAQETEGQIERLERVFEIIGQKPKGKTCDAIEGIVKESETLMKEVDDGATLEAGLLAGAQAVEHYEIARYGTLAEWAKVLGYDEAVDLLDETLEEEKRTDQLLNDMALRGINERALEEQESRKEEESEKKNRRRAA